MGSRLHTVIVGHKIIDNIICAKVKGENLLLLGLFIYSNFAFGMTSYANDSNSLNILSGCVQLDNEFWFLWLSRKFIIKHSQLK